VSGLVSGHRSVQAGTKPALTGGQVPPGGGGGPRPTRMRKWDVINRAIDDPGRTIRLCLVLLAAGIASAAPFLIAALIHGWLG
jgi:hypothetical protein